MESLASRTRSDALQLHFAHNDAFMKIAVAQISCSLGDPDANLLKVRDFSRRARDVGGAELIVFPEMTDTGYSMPVIREHASDWANGFVPGVQEIAKRISIAIVTGGWEREAAG